MPIVRVVSVSRERGVKYKDFKLVLLCQIDGNRKIVDGEWFGYVKNENVSHPFVLQSGKRFEYGGEEHAFERTNIGIKTIEVGNQFTLFSMDEEGVEHPYEIARILPIDG